MKKLAAVILAVIIMSLNVVVAFAADVYTCPQCNRKYTDIAEYNDCIDSHNTKADSSSEELHKCKTCGKLFTDTASYNECVGSHFNNVNYHYDKYVGLTVPELLAELVNIFNKTGTVDTVQTIIDKLFDLTYKAADKDDIFKAISDLELKIKDLDLDCDCLSDINGLIESLKDKFGIDETEDSVTQVEATEAELPAATGSASVGVAAFAAMAVAVAAGFVSYKKKN